MCGIVGIWASAGRMNETLLAETVASMAETVRSRGPDGDGVWVDQELGAALGHRRLSILDLTEAGSQPMTSRDGRWVIVYNGELYNAPEIADELRRSGTEFRGHCDTEVLVEAISQWGVAATVERIDAMFAFGVVDRRDRTLTLARDRVGEKPLYWTKRNGAVLFGSSLDAFLRYPGFHAKVSPDSLTSMLRYKYVPAPHTIYEECWKLSPGTTMVVEASGVAQAPVSYWSFLDVARAAMEDPFQGSEVEAADELERLLAVSVKQRLVADVPVGSFLSGGIDSSCITAMMAQHSPQVETFTIGSRDDQFDESRYAREVAAHLGTSHHQVVATAADAFAVVDDIPKAYDEPFADSSQIPTLLVSRLARTKVTVVMSGDGGDEIFGGYNRYRWLSGLEAKRSRLPRSLRGVVGASIEGVGEDRINRLGQLFPAGKRPLHLGSKVQKVGRALKADSLAEMYLATVSDWQDPALAVRCGRDLDVLSSDAARWPQFGATEEQLMAVDFMTYLPDDILTKVDRATMSVGMESRVPLFSRDIIEFAARLPNQMKGGGEETKPILRDVLYRSVPRALVDRPKNGFGIPIDDWLRSDLKGWGDELLSNSSADEFFDLNVIRPVWAQHQAGDANHGHRMWNVLTFLAWADRRGLTGA